MLVQLNGYGAFESYDSGLGLIVVIGDRKFITGFDCNDNAYIGVDGRKVLVTWF